VTHSPLNNDVEVFLVWYMKKSTMILLTVFVLMASCGIGSALTETRLSTNTADQWNPSLWGNYIVWQDSRNGGSDIYLTDMKNKVQTRITANVWAVDPCVSGNKIVWSDDRNGNSDIYMYEISTKKTTRITTNTANQTYPGVYGNYIVWEDDRPKYGHSVYLYDLSTKKEIQLPSSGWSPAIYGNNVIWFHEDNQGVVKVVFYDISTKKITQKLFGAMMPYDLSVYGNLIIYNDMFTGIDTVLYDFSTGNWIELPFRYVDDPALYDNKIVYTDNLNGNEDIYMVTLDSEIPAADFSASITSGYTPLTVKFTDKSTGSPTAWKWSFGDGSALVTQYNPTYTYTKPGTYTVKETVSNAAGKDTEIKTNYITVKAASVKPVAALSASPTSGNAPLKVQFADKSTGSPTYWKWSFGDGTYSTSKNPAHTYSKAGKYTISLTIKNAAGSNTVTKSSYINVVTPVKAPAASFTASPTSGKKPLKVQFTDKSTNSPTSWKWSFGDGTYSTSKNPAHTYSKSGKYTISLTVKNSKGSATKTASGYITVK
jgi:beta propeller repeat protein